MMKKESESMVFRYKFKVSDDLLDSYGHVNNARYLDLYERARWEILDLSGMGREYMIEHKIGPVILEVNVRFSRELLPGQEIEIISRSEVKNNIIFTIDQEMIDKGGKQCSRAKFTLSLFSLEKRKIVKADEAWIRAFGI